MFCSQCSAPPAVLVLVAWATNMSCVPEREDAPASNAKVPSSAAFAFRLQRAPPMAWDLEYTPSDDEDMLSQPEVESMESDRASGSMSSPDISPGMTTGFALELGEWASSMPDATTDEAEQLAQLLLYRGHATEQQLQQHFALLPSKPHSRNGSSNCSDDVLHSAASITFGAYVHGGIFGCHKSTTMLPWSCRLWTAIIRSVSPQHKFTSVTIARNTVSTLHSDNHNHADSMNLVISVCTGTCQGGNLWVRDDEGSHVQAGAGRGRILPLSASGVVFNPRAPHFSFDFTGLRLVAVAFHIRDSWRLSASNS